MVLPEDWNATRELDNTLTLLLQVKAELELIRAPSPSVAVEKEALLEKIEKSIKGVENTKRYIQHARAEAVGAMDRL